MELKNQTHSSRNFFALLLVFMCMTYHTNGQGISSNTQGFSVSAYGTFTNFKSTSYFLNEITEEDGTGYGVGVEIGYGITEALKVFAGYQVVNFNLDKTYTNNAVDAFEAGLKYNFSGTLSKVRPYLSGSAAWNSLSIAFINFTDANGNFIESAKLKSGGYSINAGIGLQYFISPDFSLDLGVGGKFGNFTENFVDGNPLTFDEDVDLRYLFGKIGLSYSFY